MAMQQSKKPVLLDVYMGVICLFPISTILPDTGIINKIIFILLVTLHICILLQHSMKRSTVFLVLFLIVHYMIVLFNTNFPLANYNLLAYYPFFLLYMYFAKDNVGVLTEWFRKHSGFVNFVLKAWSILVGISIFIPSCYYFKEGGARYFGSFCNTIFRLGPAAMFIQVLAIISQIFYKKKTAVIYNLIPLYCYLMGSSRTYLVIGVCVFAISWYIFCDRKALFWGTLLPMSALLLGFLAVSSLAEKIKFTLDDTRYGDFWFRITSSRSLLWENCLKAWKNLPVSLKLFGGGLGFTNEVVGRWGHNDFIEALCSAGIVGLLQYVNAVRLLYRDSYRNVKVSGIVKTCAFIVWFFNAFMNMHYTYFCATLCYPFLLLALRCYFQEVSPDKKWKTPVEELSQEDIS